MVNVNRRQPPLVFAVERKFTCTVQRFVGCHRFCDECISFSLTRSHTHTYAHTHTHKVKP